MDPDFLKNLEYFAQPKDQLSHPAESPAESSAAGAAKNAGGQAFWDSPSGNPTAGSSLDMASTSLLPSYSNTPASSSRQPYVSVSGGSQAGPRREAPKRVRTGPTMPGRQGHEKKRTKFDSDAAALESVDYWIQFDDDDAENNLGGSFEIDFSKRQNPAPTFSRPPARLNPLPSTPGLGTGLYANPVFKEDDLIDDGALENALSDDEDLFDSINLGDQLSNIESQPPSEVPPRDGLYSTPLSWEKPTPGLRANPLFGFGTPAPMPMQMPMLHPEQRRLLAIALNTGGAATGLSSGFGLGLDGDLGSEFSTQDDLEAGLGGDAELKRKKAKGKEKAKQETTKPTEAENPDKSSKTAAPSQKKPGVAAAPERLKDKGKGGDRTAHNDIERKYRTNLKDKITELRNAVPSLRCIPEEGEDSDAEEEGHSRSAPKVSKGTVLLKATEYIHHLEKRNRAIMKQHQDLARRLQAFEQLLTVTAQQPFPMPTYSRALFDPRGFC